MRLYGALYENVKRFETLDVKKNNFVEKNKVEINEIPHKNLERAT